jgi:nucleotide sugar dehydrogenase
MYKKFGIIGLGFVGGSIYKSFQLKNIDVIGYDKYKNGGIGSFNEILECDVVFLCLPTLFSDETQSYDKSAIYEVCELLGKNEYKGLIVLKSTIEPETTNKLTEKYSGLKICHNPEFLTARTAFEDFHNQKHIVLGFTPFFNDNGLLQQFYLEQFPNAEISVCSALESESMKIFCNSFYASKVMLFNEYYLLCQKNGSDFEKIKNIMLKNNWINSMHTSVPGPDGLFGYGGACFPKDTKALLNYMKEQNTDYKVLESVINECEEIRE